MNLKDRFTCLYQVSVEWYVVELLHIHSSMMRLASSISVGRGHRAQPRLSNASLDVLMRLSSNHAAQQQKRLQVRF